LGAPDLAITQVLVDILIVVFLVVIFASLPRFSTISRPHTKARDGLVALFVGTVFALLTLKVLTVDHPPAVSQQMLAQSVEKAKGANVVNTILVDFRALDTLGEITVLVMAALGVMALQRLRREEKA
jgi:multicomponent Na+:H+ antiporter subunit A